MSWLAEIMIRATDLVVNAWDETKAWIRRVWEAL